MAKERLDILIVKNGLARSREKARAMIMSGAVLVNGEREDKPGSSFPEDAVITVKDDALKYVSRGGLKLEKAIRVFGMDVRGRVCMDIGSSTGGFTDCMLQNGALKVYAVDVGYGQLDWKLRNDDRVVCMEKTNIRYVGRDDIEEAPDLATIDVSFISLSKVLGVVSRLLKKNGEVMALIKPQFEAGRDKVGKNGVVRDAAVHEEVILDVIRYAGENGMRAKGVDFSPVKGPKGNIEFLILLKNNKEEEEKTFDIKSIVKTAHEDLNAKVK